MNLSSEAQEEEEEEEEEEEDEDEDEDEDDVNDDVIDSKSKCFCHIRPKGSDGHGCNICKFKGGTKKKECRAKECISAINANCLSKIRLILSTTKGRTKIW